MLAKRVIPCLDVMDGRVVKGVNFVSLRDAGDPVENAKFYDAEGADELVFLDITASSDKRPIILDVVRRTAEAVFMPLTVGGGVRTIEDIQALLQAGADKVSINTAGIANPDFIHEASRQFGSQCIVVAIDAKRATSTQNGKSPQWFVYTHGGRNKTDLEVIDWAKRVCDLGAGEILLTSMDCDGTKSGYDVDLTRSVSDSVPVPVIASGGAGHVEHFENALNEGKADAVLAASLFHYREIKISEAKWYLKQSNIPVRL